jgi:hypothetical protein
VVAPTTAAGILIGLISCALVTVIAVVAPYGLSVALARGKFIFSSRWCGCIVVLLIEAFLIEPPEMPSS